VRSRIHAVEDVSDALFSEWRSEIKQYTSDALRRSSQQKYDMTKAKYKELIEAMKKAESKLEPALAPPARPGAVHEAQPERQGHRRAEQRTDQCSDECG